MSPVETGDESPQTTVTGDLRGVDSAGIRLRKERASLSKKSV